MDANNDGVGDLKGERNQNFSTIRQVSSNIGITLVLFSYVVFLRIIFAISINKHDAL